MAATSGRAASRTRARCSDSPCPEDKGSPSPANNRERKPTMLKPILLVEDDKRDLELTLVALERSQLANEVIVVRDGAQALDYLMREGDFKGRQEGNPAVVLLDLKLPKVNGLEVLQKVRATAHLRAMPVVMLTSSQEESDVVRSYEL